MPRDQRAALENVVPLPAPFSIQVDICGTCNLACNFCPCNTSDYLKKERHEVMTFDFFKKIIQDLKELGEKVRYIDLFGYGEPLLHPNICEMIDYTKDAGVCEYVRVTSNGTLLNKEICDKLLNSKLDRFKISLNGFSDEEYLRICDRKINFQEIVNNIDYLYQGSRDKFTIQVKATNQFIKTEEDRKKLDTTFAHISDFLEVHDIIENWVGFDAKSENHDAKTNHFHWMEKEKICTSPLIYLMIHSNGVVSPCPNDWRFDLPIGNVKEQSVKEIWQGERLKEIRLSLLKRHQGEYPTCDGCGMRNLDNIDNVANIIINRLEENC